MSKIDNRLAKLNDQLEAIKSQITQVNNVKREEEEKLLLRKQIIIGKMVLERMSNDEVYHRKMKREIVQRLKDPKHRKLFGIPKLIKHIDDSLVDQDFS